MLERRFVDNPNTTGACLGEHGPGAGRGASSFGGVSSGGAQIALVALFRTGLPMALSITSSTTLPDRHRHHHPMHLSVYPCIQYH